MVDHGEGIRHGAELSLEIKSGRPSPFQSTATGAVYPQRLSRVPWIGES